jgi:hypothetical protein
MVDEAMARATALPKIKEGTGMEGRLETVRETGSEVRTSDGGGLSLIQRAFQVACPV